MTAAEYRQALDALPYGKRLPGAVYLIDPGDDGRVPSLLRITVVDRSPVNATSQILE